MAAESTAALDQKLVFLVVEDDATSRMILRRALVKMNYEVLLAVNGEEGVRMFKENRVDMVLMDIQMPVMDGYEATIQIKASTGEEFIPVIFLTGTTDETLLARCVAVGGDDFLTKPYSPVVLNAKIDALCRIRALHKETMQQRDLVAEHQIRLIREQEVAEKLFSSMLNRAGDPPNNFQSMVSPASIFNGDLVVVTETPTGGVRVLVGDFTGYGLQAAIGALPVTDIFYSMTGKGFSMADVIRELNKKLLAILPTRMFFACALLELDAENNRLLIWSGGMPDVIVRGKDGSIRHRLPSKHLALGIQSGKSLSPNPESVPIEVGERVYMFSDGIIEATNPDDEMYGQSRLEDFIGGHQDSEALFEDLTDTLSKFTCRADQEDDFTLVEVCHDNVVRSDTTASARRVVRKPMHWSNQLVLEADTLREVDPLPLLMQAIVDVQGLQDHRERIYMVLAELFFSALDHGLLGLDSRLKETPQGFGEYYSERTKRLADLEQGRIEIELTHYKKGAGGCLLIKVKDSGAGFDFEAMTPDDLGVNQGHSGRGLALIRSICEQIVYSENGTRAEASYVWQNEEES